MKLKSIAGICKRGKSVYVLETTDAETGELRQFIGDGCAVYPAHDLPHLEKESLMAIFDVPESMREDFVFKQVKEPNHLNLNDADEDEEYVKASDILLISGGKTLRPLWTDEGALFFDTQYMAPISDVKNGIEYYVRKTPDGESYIVVKVGFLLQALIFPVRATNNEFTEEIEKLALMCRNATDYAEAKKAAEDGEQPEQIGFYDPEDGEDGTE